jgi:hypothetical protein
MLKNMSVIEKTVLIYTAFFGCLGVYLAIFNTPYFNQVFSIEDGVLEWLQFMGLATISFVFFDRAWQFRQKKSVLFVGFALLVALFFLFAAGEEISWGQRIFSVESSEFFKANNLQAETNLHNLVVGETKINKLIFGTLLGLIFTFYLAVLSPLYHSSVWVKQWVDIFGIPIPKIYQTLGYILVVLFVEVLVKFFSDTGRRGELTEFAAIYMVLLNVTFPRNGAVFQR